MIYNTYEELKLESFVVVSFRSIVIYNTYEELKPTCILMSLFSLKGFIIPMRNWNMYENTTFEVILQRFIIPMRNWNVNYTKISPNSTRFIIPMRNWNCSWFYLWMVLFLIYNTYEELKPHLLVWKIDRISRIYNTYEELKLFFPFLLFLSTHDL